MSVPRPDLPHDARALKIHGSHAAAGASEQGQRCTLTGKRFGHSGNGVDVQCAAPAKTDGNAIS